MGWSQPVHAAAASANALAGTALEFVGEECMLDIYGNGAAAGATFSLSGFRGSQPGISFIPAASPLGPAAVATKVNSNSDFITTVSIPANTRLVMPVSAAADFLIVVR